MSGARHRWRFARGFAALVALGSSAPGLGSGGDHALPHVILEGYPVAMLDALKAHDDALATAAASAKLVHPYALIMPATHRWAPGAKVRVAFLGGSPALYAQIEEAAAAWTAPNAANLVLDFRNPNGTYRTWTRQDKSYAAEVRIAFDESGYWSSVGLDSIDKSLPGGKPNEASMSLAGMDKALPDNWKGTVRHEFGHALGFQHEHQSPAGGCDFRYFNDPGYLRQRDSEGWFRVDDNGKRPGLYTYLGGKANYWPKTRVDANMKPIATTSAYEVGPYDKHSIMEYFFYAFEFEKGEQSPCYTPHEAEDLSDGDLVGVRKAYPHDATAASAIFRIRVNLESQIRGTQQIKAPLKANILGRLTTSEAR